MDSAGPRSNKERHYHRPDTGFDEIAVGWIVGNSDIWPEIAFAGVSAG
jgi:hypothetical protein